MSVAFPASVIQDSALSPTAEVISVNGRAVTTPAQVQRELRLARRTLPVLLREGGTRFFVTVEPRP